MTKLKPLLAAVCATVGIAASAPVSAISFGMDFKGYITMLGSDGGILQNQSFKTVEPFFGLRTPVSGHMILDIGLDGVRGTATIDDILFLGKTAKGREIHFEPVDSIGPIPTDTLLIGNLLFDFNKEIGIPVSIVLDMGNLTTALMASTPGDIIGGLLTAASENTLANLGNGFQAYPMGPVVVATTTWNTTDADTDGDGVPGPLLFNTNPSGVVPLLVDTVPDDYSDNGEIGIGGSPIKVGSFFDFNPNFDFKEITVTCVNLLASCASGGIPVPPLPLNPDPLGGLLGGTKTLLKGLGL
jgi:hypothetical protein